MKKIELTAERLRELLRYDPETGLFTRLTKTAPRWVPGQIVGTRAKGRIKISVDGQLYKAHRLAWLYVTGAWPVDLIDHINGDAGDNRFANLRAATRLLNVQNMRRPHKDNKAGYLGVTLDRGRYIAQLWAEGKHQYVARFSTPEEAHEAYVQAKRRHHEGCTL